MKETSGVLVSSPILPKPQGESQLLSSKFYRVFPGPNDVDQTILTIDKYTEAGNMDYEDIANALEGLGYRVDRFDSNAPMAAGWQTRGNDPVEDKHKYLRWQNRHETILLAELPSPIAEGQDANIIPISHMMTNNQSTLVQKIDVIEGIGVVKPQQPQLAYESSYDFERSNNSYLNAPADIKKAA